MHFPGHAKGLLLPGQFAHLEPCVDGPWEHSQYGGSSFDGIGSIFPLSRIMLFSIVDLGRRNVPFLTQQPNHPTGKWTVKTGRLIPFGIEVSSDLSIHEPSRIQFTDSLLERLCIGRRFVALHAPFVGELLMCPRLPV